MALGFNNSPVNWDQSSTLLSNRVGQNLGAGLQNMTQGIMQGIQGYMQKKEEKRLNEQAAELIKSYGKQMGMPDEILQDEKALKAGIESVGAENVVRMGMMAGQMKARQQEALAKAAAERAEQDATAEALAVYDKQIKGGKPVSDAVIEGIRAYAERGGSDVKRMMDTFSKSGDIKTAEGKAARDAERDKLDAAYRLQMIKESEARVNQMGADEADTPLGEAKPIAGLPGLVGVRTGKNSIQVVEANPGALKDDEKMRASLPIFNKQLQQYITDTRNEDGTLKKVGAWEGAFTSKRRGDAVALNPFFESILAQLGYPGAQPTQQPGAQPPAPVPTQTPTQTALPSELQGLF